jgi:hypothetical protein
MPRAVGGDDGHLTGGVGHRAAAQAAERRAVAARDDGNWGCEHWRVRLADYGVPAGCWSGLVVPGGGGS